MTIGVLSLNKQVGITSFGAVREVRKIFQERRVGHAGTLDPNASGVLPICIGKATRLVDYFHSQPKTYKCTVRFGVRSDTLDTEGEISDGADASAVAEQQIVELLPTFVGDIEQIPPMHSAVRHQGQHLYDIARSGATVERQPRTVTIHGIKLLGFRPGRYAEADIEVSCGKGVYMRVLAADLGELVKTGALLSWLERSSYGPLQVADAVTLEELEAMDDPTTALLPATVAIEFLPRLDLAPQLASKLQSGQSVWVPRLPAEPVDGACRAHGPTGDFLAIGELQGNLFKPTRVLPEFRLQVDRGSAEQWPPPSSPTVLTIGNFDGVHRGHQSLIVAARQLADTLGCDASLLTFDPHPKCVLTDDCPQLITTIEERGSVLASLGVNRLLVWPFTEAVSQLTATDFCDALAEALQLQGLVVGSDFALGRGRQGNVDFLQTWCQTKGIAFEIVDLIAVGDAISSSRIRSLVADGDVAAAHQLMAHQYFIDGEVVGGERVGTTLGYPTANLAIAPHKLLAGDAVYAGWLKIAEIWHAAAISVGTRPTFGGETVVVEAFVLDFAGDLYGEQVRCAFVERLREQRKYEELDELRAQIAEDVAQTRSLLSAAGEPTAL